LTHHTKIVVDLNSLSAYESLTSLGRFSLRLATALAEAASNSNFELYILVKASEQSSNIWLRDHFATLLPKQQILCWSIPKGLAPVCDAVDLTLRGVSEHIREAVIAQINPDLVVVTDLWCGWQDQSSASIGLMGDSVPTAACLPSHEIHKFGEAEDQSQFCRDWYQTKLMQFKRAHVWLDVVGISDSTYAQRMSLPAEKIYALKAGEASANIRTATKVDLDAVDFNRVNVDSRAYAFAEAVQTLSSLASQSQQLKNTKYRSPQRRPRLAYVSPLPPEHTGIASYSAELLPELAKYYDIDVIVDQDEVEGAWINANTGIYSLAWFAKHGHHYDRVLYQIGNSPFHAHMWDLLERFPGVIVLHDIFLGDATYYRSEHGSDPLFGLPMRLYADHGYDALANFAHIEDIHSAIQSYPYSLCLMQAALGVVVHSKHAKDLAAQHYNVQLAERFAVVPHLRVLPPIANKQAARKRLGIEQDTFVVCSFGHIVSNKMYSELVDAWLASPLAADEHCMLILVGSSSGVYGAKLVSQISESNFNERIKITGWTDEATFNAYLNATDLAVQLRKESRGESSGSVLDCLALGLPTICNAHGSMAELPAAGFWQIDDAFKQIELIDALTTLWREPAKRRQLGMAARQVVQSFFAPWHCAELYRDSVEGFYAQPTQIRSSLVKALGGKLSKLQHLTPITEALERSVPNIRADRQLLVDVTALAHADLQTGIQRVVRSILKCLLESPPKGFRVEPVYTAFGAKGYFYARQFTKKFLKIELDILADDPVLMLSEDIFLGLDLCLSDVFEQRHWFEQAQQRGALIYCVAYDLLPATHPHWFPASEQPIFEKWLRTIKEFDGVISISQATSDALEAWLQKNSRLRRHPLKLGVAHLGADIAESVPTKGLPFDSQYVLAKIRKEMTFLMVGTIEPRKGHTQALDAFEHLWRQGLRTNLVIVGKPGWGIETLVSRLNHHQEKDKRLLWLQSVSDEYLSLLYQSSSCLLASSEGEGFGLPLIEAAKYNLPVMARDIAVFKEVGQKNVTYFSATNSRELKVALEDWVDRFTKQSLPKSDQLRVSTWDECSRNIKMFL
jgi:glycosyltransferase involved in cell wall biosynthesis